MGAGEQTEEMRTRLLLLAVALHRREEQTLGKHAIYVQYRFLNMHIKITITVSYRFVIVFTFILLLFIFSLK